MQLVIRKVVVLTVMVALGACGAERPAAAPPPREVEVLTLSPAEVRDSGEYLGSLISRRSVTVLPQVAGYVRAIHVRPGQVVKAGAPLVDVDAREQAAALDGAEAQRRSASANLALARQTRERTEALFQEGLVSAQELEHARASLEAAEAATGAASADVSQRRVRLQQHTVRAPIAGTVGDVLVREGDFATASTVLTSVAQADALEVGVAVPAERARTLQPDAPVELLDGDGAVLVTAPVYFVAPQADPRTQLVEVRAAFRNTLGLRPAELVRARVVYGARQALQVPALAVMRQSGQAFVFAVTDRDGHPVVARRPITLGPLGGTSYVVEHGLVPGDRVAISGIQALRDTAAIKPVEALHPRHAAAKEPSQDRAASHGGRAAAGG